MTEQMPPSGETSSRTGARSRAAEGLEVLTGVHSHGTGARVRISDFVYDELTEAIRSLRLPPGTPLSEPGVAAQLQVSRAPVREAFTRLADQGLVSIKPQVGSQVAPISMRAVNDAVFLRRALEKSAFQQAIQFDDLDTSELRDLANRNADAAKRGDGDEFFETDEELHHLVFALAGVPQIWEIVRGAKVHLDRLRRLNLPGAMANGEIVDEHHLIVDAIANRDEAAGLAVIHKHSTRVINDSGKLREGFPEYFIS